MKATLNESKLGNEHSKLFMNENACTYIVHVLIYYFDKCIMRIVTFEYLLIIALYFKYNLFNEKVFYN